MNSKLANINIEASHWVDWIVLFEFSVRTKFKSRLIENTRISSKPTRWDSSIEDDVEEDEHVALLQNRIDDASKDELQAFM